MKALLPRIQRANEKFLQYYQKIQDNPFYAAAVVFAPRLRLNYLQQFWSAAEYEKAVWQIKKLWETFSQKIEGQAEEPHSPEKRRREKPPDLYDDIKDSILKQLHRPQSLDEYEEYTEYDRSHDEIAPIEWWMKARQREKYPRLSLLALEILSIPAMSDEPERCFSGGRHTVSWDRSRLGLKMIEMIECLKYWTRIF